MARLIAGLLFRQRTSQLQLCGLRVEAIEYIKRRHFQLRAPHSDPDYLQKTEVALIMYLFHSIIFTTPLPRGDDSVGEAIAANEFQDCSRVQ